MDDRTYTVRLELSDGYCLALNLSADGMTPQQEKREAAESLIALYLVLKEELEGARPDGVALN